MSGFQAIVDVAVDVAVAVVVAVGVDDGDDDGNVNGYEEQASLPLVFDPQRNCLRL